LAGVTGTFTTLTSNPKFPTKITQAVAARIDRFPYMVVSNALTNACDLFFTSFTQTIEVKQTHIPHPLTWVTASKKLLVTSPPY